MRPIQIFESAAYCSADASGVEAETNETSLKYADDVCEKCVKIVTAHASCIDADEILANFAEDVEWCRNYGAKIERFNPVQHPQAFSENPAVKAFLERTGNEGLPLFLVDGEEYQAGRYPNRCQLASWSQVAKFAVRPK